MRTCYTCQFEPTWGYAELMEAVKRFGIDCEFGICRCGLPKGVAPIVFTNLELINVTESSGDLLFRNIYGCLAFAGDLCPAWKAKV